MEEWPRLFRAFAYEPISRGTDFMIYRFALGIGLLLLGLHVGREVARSRPARMALKQARAQQQQLKRLTVPAQKISVH
jgi:hypothetical protein